MVLWSLVLFSLTLLSLELLSLALLSLALFSLALLSLALLSLALLSLVLLSLLSLVINHHYKPNHVIMGKQIIEVQCSYSLGITCNVLTDSLQRLFCRCLCGQN